MSELKPCPFCGTELEEEYQTYHTREDSVRFFIKCYECGCNIGEFDGRFDDEPQQAIDAWNTRTEKERDV